MEVAHEIPRDCCAQEDACSIDALVRGANRGSRAEEHRAGQPLRDRPLPQNWLLGVDASRFRVRTVDVCVDHGFPGVLKVLGEFGIDGCDGERHRAGHDERCLVFAQPKSMDDRIHQSQHAARALESFQ